MEIYNPAWTSNPLFGVIPLDNPFTYIFVFALFMLIVVMIAKAKKLKYFRQVKLDTVIAIISMNPLLFPIGLYKSLKVTVYVFFPNHDAWYKKDETENARL